MALDRQKVVSMEAVSCGEAIILCLGESQNWPGSRDQPEMCDNFGYFRPRGTVRAVSLKNNEQSVALGAVLWPWEQFCGLGSRSVA